MADQQQTPEANPKFDFDAFPLNTVFHERRDGGDRRDLQPDPPPAVKAERRARKDRRRRIDPTTFEKQYTDDETEFMTAMQRFKVQTGKPFPTHGEVLAIAHQLGYRRVTRPDQAPPAPAPRAAGDLTPALPFPRKGN